MKRPTTTGLVTQLTRNNKTTLVTLLGANRETHQIEFHGPLGNELQGHPVTYHERELYGRSFQVLEPRLTAIEQELPHTYLAKKPQPRRVAEALKAKAAHLRQTYKN